mgnify:CR=1 FL=1
MNRFADYFSNYVNDDTITYIGNGDITSFTVSRQDRELAVGLNLESFIDYGIIENSQNQIARAMELKKVHINPRFPKSEFSLDNIERILEYVRHESPAANGFFDGCEAELEDRTLTLCLKKGGKDVLESQKVDRAIANKIYELFDLDFVVIFLEVQAFDIEKAVQKAVEERRAEEQHKKEEEEKNVNHELWDELPVFKDTLKKIYGKAIHEKPKNIADVSTEDGYITVWGDVLKTEVRETKRGTSKIFDFDISDYTSSITVKMFDDKRVIDPLVEKINEAGTLVISGGYQFDTFSNQYVLRPYAIASIKKAEKTDDEPEKRIELHMHTSLSEMDAISSPTALVKQAIKWGHEAVAITDHGVVQALPEAYAASGKGSKIKLILGMEGYLVDDEKYPDFLNMKTNQYERYHIIFLVKEDTSMDESIPKEERKYGRKNLYEMISASNVKYFKKRPLIPKSLLRKKRDCIIVGSACEQGEVYQAILDDVDEDKLEEIASFYDYLEIQPNGNNAFMLRTSDQEYVTNKRGEEKKNRYWKVNSEEDLININKKIIALGDKLGKLVVATGDVHFLSEHDAKFRAIIMASKGFDDADNQAPLYLHTTEEMLHEFDYLGSEKAYEIVVENTNKIMNLCEEISPVRPDKCPPVIENSDEMLRKICHDRAHEIYGPKLPQIVTERLDRELNSIISNGYSVMYIIAQKLVWKSNDDGYLVGSRGSVGSSFAATMAGITEVNPLSPHYLCPKCFYNEFYSEDVKKFAGGAGCDMPDKICPNCGHKLNKLGFDIPFETFLGFKGNKEPDIDLNFSNEYQSKAHAFTEVIFGKGQTFKAGTIGTVAEKTAYGFVMKYFADKSEKTGHPIVKRRCEIERISEGCTDIRRTTGQHPGGIVVLPIGEEIHSFTPVQHPANDMKTSITTTHFDYHSIDHNLLKLDILGHLDPTMIRMLQDLTGLDPLEIPLDSKEVMSLFQNTSALGITPQDIGGCKLGALGIPEFGTDFAMQMLIDTKPQYFSDLVRIAGLAHGTDVWLGNAQTLIKEGKATISTAICTRDDIMVYLIQKGLESEQAFTIMEKVRKGKGLTPEQEEVMRAHDVPDWYIWSCKKIKYMFPKAHAAAYVMMAWRVAYCKVFYPLAYYCAYFSIRANAFDYEKMAMGRDKLEYFLADYKARKAENQLTNAEEDELKDMRIVQEMYARGFDFTPINLYQAKARSFQIIDGKIMPSFKVIDKVGEVAGESIEIAARGGEFLSKDDLRQRAKVGQTVIEKLSDLGLLQGMADSNQLSLFDL